MTPKQRHDCMASIHSKDTRPEMLVRRYLHSKGYRYRLHVRTLPGSPDIVLPKYRTVIFVNGCFWHGHNGCPKFVMPRSNEAFWQAKIARNQERDLLNVQRLESIAWNVVTIWECELGKALLPETMARTEAAFRANLGRWEEFCTLRRSNRAFAREQAKKRREMAALVAAEFQAQSASESFAIPASVKRMSEDFF